MANITIYVTMYLDNNACGLFRTGMSCTTYTISHIFQSADKAIAAGVIYYSCMKYMSIVL